MDYLSGAWTIFLLVSTLLNLFQKCFIVSSHKCFVVLAELSFKYFILFETYYKCSDFSFESLDTCVHKLEYIVKSGN